MKSIQMYSVCFHKKFPKGVEKKKVEFMSFGFPFYAKDAEEAKRVALQSYQMRMEDLAEGEKVDPKDFDLWKIATWVPEDPTPMRRCQKFVANMADLLGLGKE